MTDSRGFFRLVVRTFRLPFRARSSKAVTYLRSHQNALWLAAQTPRHPSSLLCHGPTRDRFTRSLLSSWSASRGPWSLLWLPFVLSSARGVFAPSYRLCLPSLSHVRHKESAVAKMPPTVSAALELPHRRSKPMFPRPWHSRPSPHPGNDTART